MQAFPKSNQLQILPWKSAMTMSVRLIQLANMSTMTTLIRNVKLEIIRVNPRWDTVWTKHISWQSSQRFEVISEKHHFSWGMLRYASVIKRNVLCASEKRSIRETSLPLYTRIWFVVHADLVGDWWRRNKSSLQPQNAQCATLNWKTLCTCMAAVLQAGCVLTTWKLMDGELLLLDMGLYDSADMEKKNLLSLSAHQWWISLPVLLQLFCHFYQLQLLSWAIWVQ